MRILLTATASYAPPRGGATRSNLVWLSHLAAAGHECRVVCGAPGEGAPFRRHESIGLLEVEDPAQRVQALRRQIAGRFSSMRRIRKTGSSGEESSSNWRDASRPESVSVQIFPRRISEERGSMPRSTSPRGEQ